LFETVEAAFDDVAAFVDSRFDGVGASAGAAFAAAVGDLVGAFGDGHGDAAAGQHAVIGGRGVALVPEQPVGSGVGAGLGRAGHPDLAGEIDAFLVIVGDGEVGTGA
jgi:hypothetical protein